VQGNDFVLDTVISYDFPHSTTDYIHRVGRTGRAGRTGASHHTILSQNFMSCRCRISYPVPLCRSPCGAAFLQPHVLGSGSV